MAAKNSTRLTDKFIRSLNPPAKGNVRHTDSEVPGFAVRITAASAIAFVLDYRLDDRNRRNTIGRWPEYNTTAARSLAIEYRKRVSQGVDPFEQQHVDTLEELANDYLELHARVKKSPASLKNDELMLANHIVPALGKHTKIDRITTKTIERFHIGLKDTPYQANRALALLAKMFSLAIKWNSLSENPCKGIEKFQEQPRERYLTKAELKRLVSALDVCENRTFASAIALMMLTGCRKTEALTATWDMFDLEEGVWTKPSHHTKQNRTHRVPLNAAAVALLQSLPHTDPVYAFPGSKEGQPLLCINRQWRKLRQAASVPDLRIHDLRHSFASMLASKNLSLPIIGQLLGHTQPKTTARYAHLLDEPLKEATDLVGDMIEGARS